jgi:hypothetical protein
MIPINRTEERAGAMNPIRSLDRIVSTAKISRDQSVVWTIKALVSDSTVNIE